jgi:hypothetical protein
MEPGFVLHLQDVATAAEFRGFAFGVQPRRAKGQEAPHGGAHQRQNQKSEQNLRDPVAHEKSHLEGFS